MADPTSTSRGTRFWERAAGFLARHSLLVCLVTLAVTGIAFTQVLKLEIRTDFKELLPQGTQSVRDYNKIIERVGGLGTLSVAVESPDSEANTRFVEDLTQKLLRDLGDRIRYVDYTIKPIRDFIADHGSLYIDHDDLKEVAREVRKAKNRALMRLSPFSFELDPEESKPFKLPEMKQKMDRGKKLQEYPDGYYAEFDLGFLAVLIRPKVNVTGIEGNRKFLHDVQDLITRMKPSSYHPQMKIDYAGSVQITLDEYDRLIKDLFGTALLCISLISLIVFLYFRRVRVLILLGLTLVFGVILTFGLTSITIGYVTAQTAFLGAIIAGTGINYGIILLARYLEERAKSDNLETVISRSLQTTFSATLAASITTAASFSALLVAHIRSFSQFGYIGGIGVLFCWILTFTFLPALLSLFERIRPITRGWLTARPPAFFSLPHWAGLLALRIPRPVLGVFLTMVLLGVVSYIRFFPTSLDYNLNNMRNKSSLNSGTAQLDSRINDVLRTSTSPAIILARDREQARQICEAMKTRWEENWDDRPFKFCRSVYDLLPQGQVAKLETIAQIREDLERGRKIAPEKEHSRIDELSDWLDDRPLTLNDLPEAMLRHFVEKDGTWGRFVFVNPQTGRNLWQAENLFAFTDSIRENVLPDGETITSSGEAVVFADIIRIIKKDGPLTTILSLLGVVLAVTFLLGGIRPATRIIGAILTGVFLLVGFQSVFGIKYNFFNFIALPLTFGITADYALNLYRRYQLEGPGSLPLSLETTGGAVFLCSLTTIIGYAVLLTADNQALNSFGALAITGEITGLTSAILFLPVLTRLTERGKPSSP